jgi:alkylhydroperoxidase family enzyme
VSEPQLTRLSFEQLTPDLQELLTPRVKRLGYLGEFYLVAGHQPEVLAHFYRFTESLKDALPWRLTEVVALSVAALTGNAYERVQHERLALRLGMERATVRGLARAEAETAAGLDRAERAAARLAREMAEGPGHTAPEALSELTESTNEPVAVGCALLAGRYLAHAAVSNAFGLRPPVDSPFALPAGADV